MSFDDAMLPSIRVNENSYIVVSGIKLAESIASQELLSSGFLIQSSFMKNGRTYSVLVSLSNELIARLAFPLAIKVEKSWEAYSRRHQLEILNSAVNSLVTNTALRGGGKMFLSGGTIKRPELSTVVSWIAHEKPRLAGINIDKERRATLIAEYYGPQIGLYFSFLDHYTFCLVLPSILGLLLFVHQLFLGSLDSPYTVTHCYMSNFEVS